MTMKNYLAQAVLDDTQTWLSYGAALVVEYGEEPRQIQQGFVRQGIPCHGTDCDLCGEFILWAIREDHAYCSHCGHTSPMEPLYKGVSWVVEPVTVPFMYKDLYGQDSPMTAEWWREIDRAILEKCDEYAKPAPAEEAAPAPVPPADDHTQGDDGGRGATVPRRLGGGVEE